MKIKTKSQQANKNHATLHCFASFFRWPVAFVAVGCLVHYQTNTHHATRQLCTDVHSFADLEETAMMNVCTAHNRGHWNVPKKRCTASGIRGGTSGELINPFSDFVGNSALAKNTQLPNPRITPDWNVPRRRRSTAGHRNKPPPHKPADRPYNSCDRE